MRIRECKRTDAPAAAHLLTMTSVPSYPSPASQTTISLSLLLCPSCEYDLSGVPNPPTCPECGGEVSERQHSRIADRRTSTQRWSRLAMLLFPFAAMIAWRMFEDDEPTVRHMAIFAALLMPAQITAALTYIRASHEPRDRRLRYALPMSILFAAELLVISAIIGYLASAFLIELMNL